MLYVSVSVGQGQPLGSGDVVVYLKANSEHSSAAVAEMKAELEKLMHSVGVNLRWWDARKALGTTERELVVVELRGVCDAPHQVPSGPSLQNQSALGSSAVSDGQILPFSWLDCTTLSRFIGRYVADLPPPQRDFAYGRAMARLAAHELYHVLRHRGDHSLTGIGKAQFTASDLLVDHLEFEEAGADADLVARNRRATNVEVIAPGLAIDMGNEK